MAQTEYIGPGSLKKFLDIVHELSPRKVFLVVGPTSYTASGAKAYVDQALKGLEVLEFSDLHALLEDEDVQKGVALQQAYMPDMVVAVGGGHVIDAGKAINFYANRVPLVAVPTTAGAGAEATPFAVIYKDGLKTSLEDPALVPTYAIVDSVLAASVPPRVALASGLDALCQAIESLWANNVTDESRGYANKALELVWPALAPALGGDAKAQESLSLGAHLSGKAIAISKTTACHALSYGLTYRFGVPHGLAVALTMPALIRHNGIALAHGITAEVFENKLAELGAPALASFGVTSAEVPALAAQVDPERLSNNPKPLTNQDIITIYESLL